MSGGFERLKKRVLAVLRVVGLVIAWIVCIPFYFLILGPYSIVARIALGDVMEKRTDPAVRSYWRRVQGMEKHRSWRPF